MSLGAAGRDREGMQTDGGGTTAGRSIVTRSAEETFALGAAIGAVAPGGTILCLFGDLGSGKTKLTQGIASGLSVPAGYAVTSPTFTYVNEYPGRLPLFHIDLYRITSPEELLDLGWEEYMGADAVVAVEWAERAGDWLPERRIDVAITITDQDERKFDITFAGEHAAVDAALVSKRLER